MRALGVLVALLLAAGGVAGPQFGPAREVASSERDVGSGTELTMGDVNGDRVADAVIARITYPPAHITHPIGIFLGDGRGGYVDGSSLWDGPPARTEWGRQILIADFNGDGRNDIFVADHGYDADPFPGHPNTLVLSTPQGKLVDASGNLPAEADFSHSAAAADIDGDGDLDIYVGNLPAGPGTGPPEILVNDGTGHFTRRTDLLPPELLDTGTRGYTRSLFVDVNGDGAPDLVLGDDGRTPDSRVLLNDGTGHFSFGNALPAKPFASTAIAISLATVDVNRDGHPDLLVGYTQGDPFYVGSSVQVLVNNGDGTFADETTARLPDQPTTQGWPYFLRVADLNGDGRTDFGVVLNGNGERGLLYIDDGSGVYQQVPFEAATPFWAFVDANGDGHPDIFSVQPNTPDPERHFVQLELAPVVSSFSPARGAPGTVVTVNGSNLTGPSAVKLGDVPVSFTPVSASRLTFVVPASAGSGRIAVATPSGVATSTDVFSVFAAIRGFHPSSGVSGTSVTISGAAFTGATAVTFGGTPAASFTIDSDSRITAVVGAGSTGAVRVTTASGSSAQSDGVFRFFGHAPAITGFTPTGGGVRSTVTVSGTHLDETTSVTLDGTPVSFAIVSATTLTFTVPVGATTGLIAVSNPVGASSLGTFTVTPPPSIASLTPPSGPVGTPVTITGSNLAHTVGVRIGSVIAVPTSVSDTHVVFAVPPGASTGPVTILDPDGSATSPIAFTVTG